MRLLHFLPAYVPAWKYGGPILSVSRLCEGLVQQGVEVRVITTNAGLPQFPSEQLGVPQNLNGVQVTYYPLDFESKFIWSKALVDSLPEHLRWADLVHTSSIWQPLGIPLQRASHLFRVPVIQTLRGALGPYSLRCGWWKKLPYYLLIEKPYLQRATAIHCTSNQEAREVKWLALRPNLHLLPNPIDSNFQVKNDMSVQWKSRMQIPLDQPLLLVAGRLHHKKGLDLLPPVLNSLKDLDWQIVFIGKDEDGSGKRLRTQLHRLSLQNRCHWIEELPSHELCNPYNASDCLLLPSRHENFGNVVIEALACGCGALISDKVGVGSDILSCPGVNVAKRSANAWIRALAPILKGVRPGTASASWIHARS